MANEVIEEAMRSNRVSDGAGKEYELHSHISRAEGEFLQTLILNNDVSCSIEVGCAYGISSLYICDALARKGAFSHVIIDPYQRSDWHGIGVRNLQKAGFTSFTLIEEPSEIALPELVREGRKYDFAFVDGWHTFDHVLVDFFYINRLLAIGGIVVFDDVDYPAVKKLMRYLSRYPSYKIISSLHLQLNWLDKMKSRLAVRRAGFIHRLPVQMRLLCDDSVLRPDSVLGLDSSMIAFRKVEEDRRGWDWYAHF